MPIWEALANLEKKGLAESVPYAGTRLVTLTKDDVRQIYIARTALEPVAAKYACEKITDEDIQNLERDSRRIYSYCQGRRSLMQLMCISRIVVPFSIYTKLDRISAIY